jgi:hypothetical protein
MGSRLLGCWRSAPGKPACIRYRVGKLPTAVRPPVPVSHSVRIRRRIGASARFGLPCGRENGPDVPLRRPAVLVCPWFAVAGEHWNLSASGERIWFPRPEGRVYRKRPDAQMWPDQRTLGIGLRHRQWTDRPGTSSSGFRRTSSGITSYGLARNLRKGKRRILLTPRPANTINYGKDRPLIQYFEDFSVTPRGTHPAHMGRLLQGTQSLRCRYAQKHTGPVPSVYSAAFRGSARWSWAEGSRSDDGHEADERDIRGPIRFWDRDTKK